MNFSLMYLFIHHLFFTMKNVLLLTLIVSTTLILSACSTTTALTDEQQAKKYDMTMSEFQDMKSAAARMGMTIEDHMKMMGK